jgi:hypothetical protein
MSEVKPLTAEEMEAYRQVTAAMELAGVDVSDEQTIIATIDALQARVAELTSERDDLIAIGVRPTAAEELAALLNEMPEGWSLYRATWEDKTVEFCVSPDCDLDDPDCPPSSATDYWGKTALDALRAARDANWGRTRTQNSV